MNEELAKLLYSKLTKKGDYNTFKNDLKASPDLRRLVYNKLSKKGDYATFEADLLGTNKSVVQQPVQQTPTQQPVTPKAQVPVKPKEEKSIFDNIQNFFGFGTEEDNTPKKQADVNGLIVTNNEAKERKGYEFKNISNNLDREYEQKIKSVQDKYNALQNNRNNIIETTDYDAMGGAYTTSSYKVDYNKILEKEILKLKAEKARKEGKSINPSMQTYLTNEYSNNFNNLNKEIKNTQGAKKSYLDELNKVEVSDNPLASLSNIAKTVKSVWDHNSKIDAKTSDLKREKDYTKISLKLAGLGIDPLKGVDMRDEAQVVKALSPYFPSVESNVNEALKNLGKTSSQFYISAKDRGLKDKRGLLENLSYSNLVNPLLQATLMGVEKFGRGVNIKNYLSEKYQNRAVDESYNIAKRIIDIKAKPTYEQIFKETGFEKDQVDSKVDKYINYINNNIGPENITQEDLLLFTNENFRNLATAYNTTAIDNTRENQKIKVSMANLNKFLAQKKEAFGGLKKIEDIAEDEATASAMLDVKAEESGIMSKDNLNNLAYGAMRFLTRSGNFIQNQTASGAQIITQLATAPGGDAYTPEWTDKIIQETDMLDNLMQKDSHYKLSVISDDKYFKGVTKDGLEYVAQIDADGNIKNAFGGDFEYTINNPNVVEEIMQNYYSDPEKYKSQAQSLLNTEGGKKVALENTFSSVMDEIAEELPSMIVEFGAGRIAGAGIRALNRSRQTADRLRLGADVLINTSSAMTEMYPSIYNKYKEAALDKDNDMPALLASGALGVGTLATSYLQSKAIGLRGEFATKRLLPNAIESTLETMKVLKKEFAKVPNVALREKLFNSAVRTEMFKNVFRAAKESSISAARAAGEEAAEETIVEPLINLGANFINAKITGDTAYNQETLADLNFLDPNTAIVAGLTGATLSTGMDLVGSMSQNTPFTKEEYLKKAFENENLFTSYVDIMTESKNNQFKPEDQVKMMADFKALKSQYEARKSEMGVNEDALSTMDFKNPIIRTMMGNIGLSEEGLSKINGATTMDNAIIRQVLNERELAEKKIALDDEVKKNTLTVTPEGRYKLVGDNPLTQELAQQISSYEKLQLSTNNLGNFINTFNKATKNVQKEYLQEMNEVTSQAEDILDVNNTREGSYAYKALSEAVMNKKMAEASIADLDRQITEASLTEGADTKELQNKKKALAKTIKESEAVIARTKKEYKAGSTKAKRDFFESVNNLNTVEFALTEKINSLIELDNDELIDNSDVDEVYAEYQKAFKEVNKLGKNIKKEYGVDFLGKDFKEKSPESLQELKNKIKERNAANIAAASTTAKIKDLENKVNLNRQLRGAQQEDLNIPIVRSAEEIDAILEDDAKVLELSKRLGFEKRKSLKQTKKAIKTYLTKQLASQEDTKLEAVSSVFKPKVNKIKNGVTVYEVDGEDYKPTNFTVAPASMTDEQKSEAITDAIISEIAKQYFSNALNLNEYSLLALKNQVAKELNIDATFSLDDNTISNVLETLVKLKADLDAKGFAYKFNDDVVVSVDPNIATSPILTVVDDQNNVHLIDIRSYKDNFESSKATWSKALTETAAIFQDNGIVIASINVLPIRFENSISNDNGILNIKVQKKRIGFQVRNNPISSTLLSVNQNEATLNQLEEQGLLTEEQVEKFNEIPLDETDSEETNADNLDENSQVVLENVNNTETEIPTDEVDEQEDINEKEINKVVEITPTDTVVEESEEEGIFLTGLNKGTYIRIKNYSNAFYTIKIFGNDELANKYGGPKYSLQQIKQIYKDNNWKAPKSFKKSGTYQLLDASTNTPILSTSYVDRNNNGEYSDIINDVTVIPTIIGVEVEIVENNENGVNDTQEVQNDFLNKASFSVVYNGQKIASISPNSKIRKKLKTKNVDGRLRLLPTTSTIKDVQYNDFNRQELENFSDWELKALNSGVLVPGEYQIIYIGVENQNKVFKNQSGTTIPGSVPENAPLGATYLLLTNNPSKNILIPMMVPKLSELGYTAKDFKQVFDLIDKAELTKGNPEGVDLLERFVALVNKINKKDTKSSKIQQLKDLISFEFAAGKIDFRSKFTESQLSLIEGLTEFDEIAERTIAKFLLDRLITLNNQTKGLHKIGVNPEVLFIDNALVLENVKTKKSIQKQVLPTVKDKNKNTDLVKETYYEPYMTESEDGRDYVFFHKSNATPEELATGIDSRKFTSLRTSRTEKGTQYGVASYYTLPTDGERMVGGETYTVSVPKKKVYPMDSDPNGYKSIAETIIPENAPFRMENIKKEMVRMAAEDGYLMAVGMWYFDPAGNPLAGPALRADAIVPLVPQTLTYRKATDKQIDHPMKKRMEAMDELRPLVSKFESERSANQDYKEGYSIAQDTRMGKMIPNSVQFDIMVAGLPESMNADIERARELVNMLNGVEETPSADSEVASATMSAVVSRLKETGLANEVFEMTNNEIVEKLVELGIEENIAKQIIGQIGARTLDFSEESTIRLDNLMVAKDMEVEGKDTKTIRLATGWEKGADGLWRYEIEDSKVKYKWGVKSQIKTALNKPVNLEDVFTFPELFKAYPQLKELQVEIKDLDDKTEQGFYSREENKIVLNKRFYSDNLPIGKEAESILLHEVQHAIQDIEGFAQGSSPDLLGSEKYKNLMGETESRNVQERMFMTKSERIQTLLEETEDVAREDQLFLRRSLGVEKQSAMQITRSIESRGGQRGTRFESAIAPESIVRFFNTTTMGNTLVNSDAMETLNAIENYLDLSVSITSPTYSELQAFAESLGNKIDNNEVDFNLIEEETGVTKADIEKMLQTAEKRLESFEGRNMNKPLISVSQAIERNNGNPLNLAPNGKPSILYQSYKDLGYSDSEAERLTAQVYSDNFISWFGDWINDAENASKVVDTNGMPKIKWRGDNNPKNVFDYINFGKYGIYYFGDKSFSKSFGDKLNVYFINSKNPFLPIKMSKKEEKEFRNILKKDVNLLLNKIIKNEGFKNLYEYLDNYYLIEAGFNENSNPLDILLYQLKNGINYSILEIDTITELIKSNNYDGYESYEGNNDNIAVYNPNQIKSATENIGAFSTENNDIRYQKELSENNITPITAGFVYNGDVYLNMEKMNLDTPIHEFGHLWLSWAKNNLGEAYTIGLELAKSSEAEPYRQYVMDTQPDLKVDTEAFLEEVLAQAIGDNGARLVEENSTKTKSWLQELWDAIGKMLGLSQYTADQIMNMTLNDYATAVAVDLLSGNIINKGEIIASEELQKQAVAIMEGKESLKKFGLSSGKNITRKIGEALEARQRAKYGIIDQKDNSPEARKKISNWMVDEVKYFVNLMGDKSGKGWYGELYQKSLDAMAKVFPEMKTDQNARDLFTMLVAITSDGQKVMNNFKMAAFAYDYYNKNGVMPKTLPGQRVASFEANLKKINDLLNQYKGDIAAIKKDLMEVKSIEDINKERKKEGLAPLSTNWPISFKAPFAASIFGPKLGMFYANLSGNEAYPTLDRWWSRTFNRYRGTLIPSLKGGFDKKGEALGLDRFKQMLGNPEMTNEEALLASKSYRDSYVAKGYKSGTDIEKAANTIYKIAFENLNDVPFTKNDRLFMYNTISDAVNKLNKQGYDLSIADVQAILWYFEKNLYKTLGVQAKIEGISYEDAANYTYNKWEEAGKNFNYNINPTEEGQSVEDEDEVIELEDSQKVKKSVLVTPENVVTSESTEETTTIPECL